MTLFKLQDWYNPYYITVKDKTYLLDKIIVFENGAEVIRKNQSWFGSNNNVKTREITGDVVKKNKIDFNCKTAFIVKSQCTHDVRYDLYIPESYLNLNEPTYSVSNDGEYVIRTFKSSIYNDIEFEEWKKIKSDLDTLANEVREIGKNLSMEYRFKSNPELLLVEINKLIDIYHRAVAERNSIDNCSIDELLGRC